jgi:anti-sigma regulatory factor (Ser/Thr protein kinase)
VNVLLKKTYKSSSDVLKDVRDQVRDICEKQKINKSIMENIVLAVNEACMNIIQHGYNNNPDNEFSILVSLSETNKKKELVIKLVDHAKKIDPSKIKSRALDDVKPGGIGVHIIHKLMDSAMYLDDEHNNGNTLELRKIL